MPISNMQWRVEVGINATSKARYFKKKSLRVPATVFCFLSFGFRFVFILLIYLFVVTLNLIRVLKTGTRATISQSVIGI